MYSKEGCCSICGTWNDKAEELEIQLAEQQATYSDLEYEYKKLLQQIQDMKNCNNCKYNWGSENHCKKDLSLCWQMIGSE